MSLRLNMPFLWPCTLTHQLGGPVGRVWTSQPIHGIDNGLVSVGRPEGVIVSLQIVNGKLAVVVPASLGSLFKPRLFRVKARV